MKSKVSIVQIDLILQQLYVLISLLEQSESLPGKDIKSGSPTDDDFQPAKKRFRTPGNNQVIKTRIYLFGIFKKVGQVQI